MIPKVLITLKISYFRVTNAQFQSILATASNLEELFFLDSIIDIKEIKISEDTDFKLQYLVLDDRDCYKEENIKKSLSKFCALCEGLMRLSLKKSLKTLYFGSPSHKVSNFRTIFRDHGLFKIMLRFDGYVYRTRLKRVKKDRQCIIQ